MDAVCQKVGAVPRPGSCVGLPEGGCGVTGKGAERTFGPDGRVLMFCGLLRSASCRSGTASDTGTL